MKTLKLKTSLVLLFVSVLYSFSYSQGSDDSDGTKAKQETKINASAKVLTDFSKMKESIPKQLLEVTEGIIVIPKLINAGFVLAGKRGKGIAVVKLADGSWSNPAFITLTGGSVGFQAGVQSVDLVLIFKNSETLKKIGGGSFTLGGDISVTAGPVGRNSSASTDYKLEAEVYSYSRSKGLFAGISLSGSALDVDDKANANFYGENAEANEILAKSSMKENTSITSLNKSLRNIISN